MSLHYLVTGGSGFLGSALVRRLVRDGHRVRVLDDNSRGAPRRLEDVLADVDLVVGDVRDAATVISAAKGVDAVIHMAAINGTEFFYSRPEAVLDVSVRGMLAVIDACRQNGIGNLVVASSSEAYQSPETVPTPEDVPLVIPDVLNPRYSYGGGKIASELIAVNYGRTGFNRVAIFRPHNVYGPDMGWEHVIPQLALRAHELTRGKQGGTIDFPILGDGQQTRAFVHVDDFTEGLARVIAHGEHLGIYHIGSDEETTIADLARRIVAYFGCEAVVRPSEAPTGETKRRCPDITKLRRLGYNPKIMLDRGLADTVAWYAANRQLMPAGRN